MMRALVVDDDPVVRQVHTALLRRRGIEPIEASNGVEAMRALQAHWPLQIVLIDWHMSPLNGYAFTAAIRADPDFAGLRIVMVTSEERPERISQAYDIGVDAVLTKPLKIDRLIAALDRTLATVSAGSESRPVATPAPELSSLAEQPPLQPTMGEVATRILERRGLRLGAHIGHGGMADIFEAIGEPGAPLALKISSTPMAAEDVISKRFQREASLLQALDHPQLLHVQESGVEQGYCFMLMERLEGDLLHHLQASGGRLSPTLAHRLISACARGLQAVHAAGFVHRDIKPANILMRRDGSPVISDFGLAAAQRDLVRLTQAGKVLGTPAYMAPEAVLGKAIHLEALDIYSLGATWFHCLTGFPPFERDTVWETFKCIVHHPVPDLEQLIPDLSPDQRHLLASCLAKHPEQRPQDAVELVQDLADC